MFNKIRDRLIINNIIVFALVLGGGALAARLVFASNLRYQMGERLIALGQGIVAEAELEQGELVVEDEFLALPLLNSLQSFEWFDLEGTSVESMGAYFPEAPFDVQTVGEVVRPGPSMQAVTLPVSDDDTGAHIGYVRVSQRTDEISTTLFQLDMGLLAGMGVAMLISYGGILWLNRQAMAPIEESFQRLKQFTADASHELRNPLMAISSNVEVALKYPAGMRDADYSVFKVVDSATDQMTRLTEDLLLLARTDGFSKRTLAPVNVSDLLRALLQLYHPQIVCKKIELRVDMMADVRVQGESASLGRAFGNLLQNAIRYTPVGGKVEVTSRCVGSQREGSQIEVVVSDTGIGIEKENLAKIFERFWRADQARVYDGGGSGLGLSITQAVINSHGGTMKVTSQVGVGSCFTVRLPILPSKIL